MATFVTLLWTYSEINLTATEEQRQSWQVAPQTTAYIVSKVPCTYILSALFGQPTDTQAGQPGMLSLMEMVFVFNN